MTTLPTFDDQNPDRRGMMLVLSSPSGTGKTSLSRALLAHDPRTTVSISMTTRPMRPGEYHGRDYFFVEQAEFEQQLAAGALLEHARVFENYYGTPRAFVEAQLVAGKDIIFDIDWQGTRQLAESARADLVSIFILPPSLEELERRLRSRATDSEEVITRRMAKAEEEISHWTEYDYVLVNRDFAKTLGLINAILQAERCKRNRQTGLAKFVESL